MYDFMKETVIMCAFMLIIMMDIWGLGFLIASIVKWVRKKLRGNEAPLEETETAETE